MKDFVISAAITWIAVKGVGIAADRWNFTPTEMIYTGWLCGLVFGTVTFLVEKA